MTTQRKLDEMHILAEERTRRIREEFLRNLMGNRAQQGTPNPAPMLQQQMPQPIQQQPAPMPQAPQPQQPQPAPMSQGEGGQYG